MCKMPNIQVGIKRLDFTEKRGKMAVYLTYGREIIVPVSMFKDISAMQWYVLVDQYFTFENMSKVYSVTDVLDYNMVQH